jgi:Glutaredoxin and related proteins
MPGRYVYTLSVKGLVWKDAYCLLTMFLLLGMSTFLFFFFFFFTEDGVAIQQALFEKTKQKTVPNVFINGKHVGGCDATIQAHENGRLAELLSGVQYDYDLIVIGGGSGGLAASKVSDCCVLF